jgi:hypothetical protein
MSEVINTEGTLIWRHGEPVYTMSSDRNQGHATLEYAGNILQFYSLQKELYSIQLANGTFLMGVGNPFYNRSYREEISCNVAKDETTYGWLRDCFNKCGIHTVEQSVMFEIKGCTRLTVGESGLWHLFLPDGRVQSGLGNCAPDSPQMKVVSQKMKDYFSTRFMYYITSLFDLLKPIEVETLDEYNNSLSARTKTTNRKNRLITWLLGLANKLIRWCGGFRFLLSRPCR